MPIFEYKGLSRAGKNVKGNIDADNIRTARARLKKDGIFVTDISDKKKQGSDKNKRKNVQGKSVPVDDLSMMTRQLATLIKANIPLVDALAAVSEQVENPVLQEAVADVKNMVNEGQPLAKSLAKYPNIFDNIYLSMCEAGEMSGSLDVILIRLSEFTEAASNLRSKVKSAMTYPVIMLIVTLGLLAVMFIFVVPKMVAVFESSPELTLPWYTVMIINLSGVMVNYWWLILAVGSGGWAMFKAWVRSPEGSKKWDQIVLTLPYVGPMARMIAVSRFTRTLSTLLTGGVPMLNALDIVRNVVNNNTIAVAIDEARENISEGESISVPLKRSGQFPPIVLHMINIGEKTGELENMLLQVSDAYDFQVKVKLESVTSIMGPIVIVVMGVVIGVIVFSIMIPIFEMTNMGGAG